MTKLGCFNRDTSSFLNVLCVVFTGSLLVALRYGGMVRVWVAGKTVWSHCYTRAIPERFRDKELIIKRYIYIYIYLYSPWWQHRHI